MTGSQMPCCVDWLGAGVGSMVSRLNTLTALIRSNCGGSSSRKNSFQADQIFAVAASWYLVDCILMHTLGSFNLGDLVGPIVYSSEGPYTFVCA